MDYDLIVIGGGAAGLVAATGAAGLGAKTVMIEKNKLGGDCTWYGCVPSKALLRSAHVLSLSKRLKEFGISSRGEAGFDATNVMAHVREVIAKVSSHHPPEVFEKRGIKVIFGSPKFLSNREIEVNGEKLKAKRFIIATGSHPLVPPIEGLKDIEYLTNETIFDLEKLPRSIIVLGGGPIGIELSQALLSLGVEVKVVEAMDEILFREDNEVAGILSALLIKAGIKLYTGKKAIKFTKGVGFYEATLEGKDKVTSTIKAEAVLVAVGRSPNVQGLDLERAGIEYSPKGIKANKNLKTTAKNIYVCGDIVGPYQFSHIAEYQAVVALGNALTFFKQKVNYSAVPWCTFTHPELAHVGLTEEEARRKCKDIKIYKSKYSESDRAVTDLEEQGLTKVICDKKGIVLGAHIVGANAGEIIHGYVVAMANKLKLSRLSSTIHIYPTLAQMVKRTGDQTYNEIFQSKWFKLFSNLMIKLLR